MKSNLFIPIITGAAVAAGLTYLLNTDEGEKLRGRLADQINEQFPDLAKQLTALKDQFLSPAVQKSEAA
jgi:hypothetical protein